MLENCQFYFSRKASCFYCYLTTRFLGTVLISTSKVDSTTSLANASEVATINGLKASQYIEQWANTVSINQDIDANYNNMFASAVSQASGAGPGFFFANGRTRYLYPGPNTTFTYSDGTTRTDENIAQIKGDFAGVIDGPSFYQKFCTVAEPVNRAAFQPTVEAAAESIPGYPKPIIATSELEMTGYYLEGVGNEDVAVGIWSQFFEKKVY